MKQNIKIFTAILFLSMGLMGCKKNHLSDNQENKSIISDSILQSLPKAQAQLGTVQKEIFLNGRIVPDEAKQASVYALVSGRISQVNVELGDYVRKGEILAVLKSAEVAAVNNELALAKSNVEIARTNMNAYKELYDSKLVSERDYISVKTEYQKALSELEKTEQVAAITGGENSAYLLKAPLDGYVIAKNINNNSEVRDDMSEPLFSIADLSVVWVLADVFEIDIAQVQLGQTLIISALSNPEKHYIAKIDKIYTVLDPQTRSMKVRAALKNIDNELIPGMFVSVKLVVDENRQAIAIPNNAIVFDNNKNHVVVLEQPNYPKIKEVKEVTRSNEKCYVTGIEAGETVITGSQVFVYQELVQQK